MMKKILFAAAALCVVMISACKKDERNIEQFDTDNIQEYIRANNLTMTQAGSSGLYYQVIKAGTGDTIAFDKQIPIIYTLKSIDGRYTNTDTTRTRYANFFGYFTPDSLRNVIKNGLVREGGEIRIIIPSRFAYKTEGSGSIPGNASLDYTLHVLDRKGLTAYNDAVIQKYMQTNSLTGFTRTNSGLYYKIGTIGGDTTITGTSYISANYTGKLMDGAVFQSGSLQNTLNGLVPGWVEAVPKIRSGGSIRILLPPALGYGIAGSQNTQTGAYTIPPYACLDFDITVTSVTNSEVISED